MRKKIINLIRSETWLDDDFKGIALILDETISEFVDENDRIINIEMKEKGGQKRFWIYVETIPKTSPTKRKKLPTKKMR